MNLNAYLRMPVLAVVLIASPLPAQEANVKVITKTLTSSGAHKECLSLATTQSLRYWFRSEAPIDFNIQYQDGDDVVYPVKREKVTIGSGSYVPKAAQVHCMVLTNLARRPVTVRIEFARVDR